MTAAVNMTGAGNLTHDAKTIEFPETHYVFVERQGHIPTIARQAWQAVHAFFPEIVKQNRIVGGAALYKCDPVAGATAPDSCWPRRPRIFPRA
jgi:predicted transcriptional regulator YdeE